MFGRFRVRAIRGEERPVDLAKTLHADLAKAGTSTAIADHYFANVHPQTSKLIKALADSKKRNRIDVRVLGERTKNPRNTYIFHRGDFLQPNKELGEMRAAPPRLAHAFSPRSPDRSDRTDLA